jgi:IS5 family transposase
MNQMLIVSARAKLGQDTSLVVKYRSTHKQGLVIASQSIAGNPYDGHTLKSALKKSEELTNIKIQSAFVDKGYKGHGINPKEVTIFILWTKKTQWQKPDQINQKATQTQIGN